MRSQRVWITGRMRAVGQRHFEEPQSFFVESFRAGHAHDDVHGHIDTRGEAVTQAFPAIGMARDFQTAPVRFVDDGLVFFESE